MFRFTTELLILFNIVVLQHGDDIWETYLAIDYSVAIITLLTTISLMIGLGSEYREHGRINYEDPKCRLFFKIDKLNVQYIQSVCGCGEGGVGGC
jgi:hypothetical protein